MTSTIPQKVFGRKRMGGTSADDLWMFMDPYVVHREGSEWKQLPVPSETWPGFQVTDAAFAGKTAWLLGSTPSRRNMILRWNEADWELFSAGKGTADWNHLWSPEPGEIWAIGEASNVYRLRTGDGTTSP